MVPAEYAYMRIMQDRGIQLVFHPPPFQLNGTRYHPDFYCEQTGEYIEVSGTRQGFQQNKAKYALFRATYPTLTLKIVRPDGQEIQTT